MISIFLNIRIIIIKCKEIDFVHDVHDVKLFIVSYN